MKSRANKFVLRAPAHPGVYVMKDVSGGVLYVGKAGNLRRRVASYFTRAGNTRVSRLVSEIRKIRYLKTETALDALVIEANLIKKYQPPFNVKEKDNRSFLYVEITDEKFPRVLLARGRARSLGGRYGPYASASQIREGLAILRKIFPFSTHTKSEIGKFRRPCLNFELGLCPGVCAGIVSAREYAKNIRNLALFLAGKKKAAVKNLELEMKNAAKNLEFEKAARVKRSLFTLAHLQGAALISENEVEAAPSPVRAEGYDISHIGGAQPVGSMAVLESDRPARDEYRRFKIKTVGGVNDTAMLKEVLSRRLSHREWRMPDVVLVDGGAAQVRAARAVLRLHRLRIPVVGIAKGPRRKKNEIIGAVPSFVSKKDLVNLRDEAHRFAIAYHKKLRRAGALLPAEPPKTPR